MGKGFKVGIISDTHKKVKKAQRAIETLVEDGAEFLIHAGDIVEPEILELLKKSGLRYVAVYGNNDAHLVCHHDKYNLVQEPHYFKLANTSFKLMHLPFYMTPDTQVVLFGHTHTMLVEFNNGTLFLNSGEVCARNNPVSTWQMLEVREREFLVTSYSRQNKSDEISKKEQIFERRK